MIYSLRIFHLSLLVFCKCNWPKKMKRKKKQQQQQQKQRMKKVHVHSKWPATQTHSTIPQLLATLSLPPSSPLSLSLTVSLSPQPSLDTCIRVYFYKVVSAIWQFQFSLRTYRGADCQPPQWAPSRTEAQYPLWHNLCLCAAALGECSCLTHSTHKYLSCVENGFLSAQQQLCPWLSYAI